MFSIVLSISGCESCRCDNMGSYNDSCDIHTGQCPCKEGVTGQLCDECEEFHYGFSSRGCKGKISTIIDQYDAMPVTSKFIVSNYEENKMTWFWIQVLSRRLACVKMNYFNFGHLSINYGSGII